MVMGIVVAGSATTAKGHVDRTQHGLARRDMIKKRRQQS
jgi:hypothetical protein